jgi:serine/threonine protein kinase
MSDRERLKLLNKLCKTCSRHRVIPKSMHIPDCSKGAEEIDRGGFANVSRGTYKGRRVAIKVVRVCLMDDLDVILSVSFFTCIVVPVWMNGSQRFCREAVAWKHLRHPNVLPLLGVTVSERRFAMVSKWMAYGNINEFVEKDEHINRTELVRPSSISTPSPTKCD